jgi:TPR repeat protein
MDDIFTCYRILDLEAGASLEEVKRSYRELVKVWHPDRFRGDPKLQAKAEEKLKRINLAYERLSKEAATGAAHGTASQPQPKPYPPRTGPKPRATQAQSPNNPQPQPTGVKPAATATDKRTSYLHGVHRYWVSAGVIVFLIFMLVMLRKPHGLSPQTRIISEAPPASFSRFPTEPEFVVRICAKAEQGDAQAENKVGGFYANGQFVRKNDTEAVKWYRKAAEQGYAEAQYNLGVMYADGRGVAKSEDEAVKWYRKAAENGDIDAQSNLGRRYEEGRGVPKDSAESLKWYRKATAQRDAATQSKEDTTIGQSVLKDEDDAVKRTRVAAVQGNAEAQYKLALMLEDGKGIPKDEVEALKWYRKAAEQGYAPAQNILGVTYTTGHGVPNDDVEAVKWYRKAAEQGNASAQTNLGGSYSTGRGVPKDDTEGVKWYRKAAEQGDATAQNRLGVMYAGGQGVAKDDSESLKWYRKAAEHGNASAQTNIGNRYANGRGVPKDEDEAVKWYRKAAEQGNASAQAKLKALTDVARLRHLPTDDRLTSGSLLVDRLQNYSGKGKLTLDNGLAEDAYVKLVWNGKLVAAFYVRSHEKFTYSTIPDGAFSVLYCTGYGWDGTARNFTRGRHARRYDEPIGYATRQERDSTGITTYTDTVTLTLHKVIGGNAKASDTSIEDFDRY